MMKTSRIALIISICFSFLCLLYAFLQKFEADRNFLLAETRRVEAEALKVELGKTKQIAEKARAEAMRQQDLAAQVMAECEKSIKK